MTSPACRVSCGLAVLSLLSGLAAQSPLENAKLVASDRQDDDFLGSTVVVRGTTVVSGAWGRDNSIQFNTLEGAVYVFEKDAGGWRSGTEVAILEPSVPLQGDAFGRALDFDGQAIVVGADSNATIGFNGGAVYVFEKPAGGWVSANETARLTASDRQNTDLLGSSVVIAGDAIAAGAPRDAIAGTQYRGSVYVFEKPPEGWADATETTKIESPDLVPVKFGDAVAMTSDTLVIGAPGGLSSNPKPGAAYVYEKQGISWTSAVQVAVLSASVSANQGLFGSALAIQGDTIVVGANGSDTAYVFEKPPGGWVDATETAILTASNGQTDISFGWSVDIDGDTIGVSAYQTEVNGNFWQGSAHLFERPAGGWVTMTETTTLTASDGTTFEFFGNSISLDGSNIAIGAGNADIGTGEDQGAVYVFERAAVVPESGCGLPAVVLSGSVRTGTSFTISMPQCTRQNLGFALGRPGTGLGGSLGLIPCGDNINCVLSCLPVAFLPGPTSTFNIEGDPALVGRSFCIQGLCLEGACVRVTDLATVTISR